jgi:hypothetical protein
MIKKTSSKHNAERIFKIEQHLAKSIKKREQAVFDRFPLPFTLLSAFGLVATFYGFEHIIDTIPILAENPMILLATGVVVLVTTGTLYKKLQ